MKVSPKFTFAIDVASIWDNFVYIYCTTGMIAR
ncbi:hypothetical protein SHPE106448_10350 [Shewanella pealeana]